MLKQGNSAKMLETYVSGVSELTAYACTAGSSDRTLIVTATSTEGEVVQTKGVSSGYVSTAVTLSLDASKSYGVTYTGVMADNESDGADMVLHGIRFVAGNEVPDGMKSVSADTLVDIFDTRGLPVKRQVTVGEAVRSLPSGIYIIDGCKVWVK